MQLALPMIRAQQVAPRLAQGCQAHNNVPRFSRRWMPLPGSARGSIPRCAHGRVPSSVSGCGWRCGWQHTPAHYNNQSSAVNGSVLDLHRSVMSLNRCRCPGGNVFLVIYRVSCLVRKHFSSPHKHRICSISSPCGQLSTHAPPPHSPTANSGCRACPIRALMP